MNLSQYFLRDDTGLGSLQELYDVTNLLTVRHLLLNLQHSVEGAVLRAEEQSVSVGHVLLHLLVDVPRLHHRVVRTRIFDGVATGDGIRRYIVRETRAGLKHGEVAHTCARILDDGGTEDDTVADLAVARYLCTVAEDVVVADLRVVRDMHALHQEVTIADNGLAALMGSTVDDDILADDIVVADLHQAALATEVKVLRQRTDNRTLVDLIVLADLRPVENTDERKDDGVVTYLHVVLYEDEGEYLNVVADLRLWRYHGFITDVVHSV